MFFTKIIKKQKRNGGITRSSCITQAAKWRVEGNSKSASNSAIKQIKVGQ
jgi:hypothetical protein